MAVHDDVLAAARRLARLGRDWTFRMEDVVRELPHLNERSVRTHIGSRCCVNAPAHHQHRWPYFRRVARGRYQVERKYRTSDAAEASPSKPPAPSLRDTVHAVITGKQGAFTAECLEVAVVTEGRSLDETLVNLQEALTLHCDGEDLQQLGLVPRPRLVVTYEPVVRIVA
jgi:predicted RNase H-like HicB family nuclease